MTARCLDHPLGNPGRLAGQYTSSFSVSEDAAAPPTGESADCGRQMRTLSSGPVGMAPYSIGSKPEAQEPGWRFEDLFQSYKPICLARKGLIFSYTDPRREESEAPERRTQGNGRKVPLVDLAPGCHPI